MDALASSPLIFFLLPLFLLPGTTTTAAVTPPSTVIGVTYTLPFSTHSDYLTPELVAAAVNSYGFRRVRLPHHNPKIMSSFANSNVSLFLCIPNYMILELANNSNAAVQWLYVYVLPYYPSTNISIISVGEDADSSELMSFILPAIKNLHLALRHFGISKISVSTTFSFHKAVTTLFPPSSATFQKPLGELVMRPLLQFLEDTNSSFLVNLYPHKFYKSRPEIPLSFSLFEGHPFHNFSGDYVTGYSYRNLFDMMVDAVITSMALAGHRNVPIVVAETGWPCSRGKSSKTEASTSEKYIRGLLRHLRSGMGTPMRREGVAQTYIFELFDRFGEGEQQNWGIMYNNMTQKYKIYFGLSPPPPAGNENIIRESIILILILIISMSIWYLNLYPVARFGNIAIVFFDALLGIGWVFILSSYYEKWSSLHAFIRYSICFGAPIVQFTVWACCIVMQLFPNLLKNRLSPISRLVITFLARVVIGFMLLVVSGIVMYMVGEDSDWAIWFSFTLVGLQGWTSGQLLGMDLHVVCSTAAGCIISIAIAAKHRMGLAFLIAFMVDFNPQLSWFIEELAKLRP